MNRILFSGAAALALVVASSAHAAGSIGPDAGFVAPHVIDFEQAAQASSLDAYYVGQGVTFSGGMFQTYQYDGLFDPELSGGNAQNFDPAVAFPSPVDFTILFATAQRNAAFSLVTSQFGATLETYLGATLVDSVTYTGGYQPGANWIRFLDSNFDSIRFLSAEPDGDGAIIDNLSFDNGTSLAVPEPATWSLMIAGFGLAGGALRRRRTAVVA